MNQLADIFGDLSLTTVGNEFINYSYFNFFKNPNRLPINEVFLERKRYELDRSSTNDWEVVKNKKSTKKLVTAKNEVIPALHESWLPRHIPAFEYHEYSFSLSEEENINFIEGNQNYLFFLEHLIKCSYHQFWCSIIFNKSVQDCIKEFMRQPIPPYLCNDLEKECKDVYKQVFNKFYVVACRLVYFKESETEYMAKNVGTKHLIDTHLLNLSTAMTITLLYSDFDSELINELGNIYFSCSGQEKFIEKEVEHFLKEFILICDSLSGRLSGKIGVGKTPVPICLEERPRIFSLLWVNSAVNYCLNMICTLSSLFRLRNSTVEAAFHLNLPVTLAENYNSIFSNIYGMLESRRELIQNDDLYIRIMEKIGYARSKFVENFHNLISFILEKTISLYGKEKEQEKYLELFIDTMSAVLEYEIFICDYNHKYPLSQTIEVFEDFSSIDKTRTEYVITALNNIERNDFIKEKFSIEEAFITNLPQPVIEEEPQPSCSTRYEEAPGCSKYSNDVDKKIESITSIFPHLGDGFVEMCLKHFDYNSDQVVQAILEENIPPHLAEIAFDTPRIPPEPEPPKPSKVYRGKKPILFDDALSMLNDKKEKEKMKTLVLDGIKYNNRYDNTDDEYDDRDNLLEPDFVVEHEVEKYEKLNVDDLESDTSYSDNEFDDEGKAVEKGTTTFKPFCEDPAIARAKYEARMGIRKKKTDVVGKPKGQGQEKNVLKARERKTSQKSTRANHSRKGGAQFKRNRGMIPS